MIVLLVYSQIDVRFDWEIIFGPGERRNEKYDAE